VVYRLKTWCKLTRPEQLQPPVSEVQVQAVGRGDGVGREGPDVQQVVGHSLARLGEQAVQLPQPVLAVLAVDVQTQQPVDPRVQLKLPYALPPVPGKPLHVGCVVLHVLPAPKGCPAGERGNQLYPVFGEVLHRIKN